MGSAREGRLVRIIVSMKLPLLSYSLLLVTSAALAAELPKIPAEPIAKKKELLFSEDFSGKELKKPWGPVVPTFTVEDGALKGTQTKVDAPAQDGKPAVKGHQAVIGTDIPTKDSIVELKFKFAGATGVSVEFDDRNFKGSHYGHICMTRITPKTVIMIDQKDGGMSNQIMAMTDPAQKAERAKLLQGRSATFPVETSSGDWHTLVVETVGDEMRTSVDGKAVGFLKSSGIAHPTKSKVEFGCMGKDGYFKDLKIWNAEPVK